MRMGVVNKRDALSEGGRDEREAADSAVSKLSSGYWPGFSFKEEAEMFLQYAVADKGWLVRETTTGELISVLYGPCAGVERVALDPPPEIFAEAMTYLVSLRRERFVRVLMGKYEKIPDWESLEETSREIAIPTTLCGLSAAESRRPRDRRLMRAVGGE